MRACSVREWTDQLKPALAADSLEDVSWEAEATPGLQQLARVLPIQLQVLNGADDLCMHISKHPTQTSTVNMEGRGSVETVTGRETRRERQDCQKTSEWKPTHRRVAEVLISRKAFTRRVLSPAHL